MHQLFCQHPFIHLQWIDTHRSRLLPISRTQADTAILPTSHRISPDGFVSWRAKRATCAHLMATTKQHRWQLDTFWVPETSGHDGSLAYQNQKIFFPKDWETQRSGMCLREMRNWVWMHWENKTMRVLRRVACLRPRYIDPRSLIYMCNFSSRALFEDAVIAAGQVWRSEEWRPRLRVSSLIVEIPRPIRT